MKRDRMKVVLEVIGALVLTLVILVVPILSFVSFIYDWHSFLKVLFLVGLMGDFLFILDKLI